MYIPKQFEVNDTEKQLEVIKEFPLGALIFVEKTIFGSPNYTITHIPFVIKEDESTGKRFLIGHLAKKNEQVPLLKRANHQCLVAFTSTDSYVSPSWYPTKKKTHKFVPTWDFAAVNVYGTPKIIESRDLLLEILTVLSDQEENKRPDGEEFEPKWKVSDAPEAYIDQMMKNIVGLEIEIEKIEAKFKFNQNVAEIDAKGVVENYEKEVGGEKGTYMSTKTKALYPREI